MVIGLIIILGFMLALLVLWVDSLIKAIFGNDCWIRLSRYHPIRWIKEDIDDYFRRRRLRKFQRKKK